MPRHFFASSIDLTQIFGAVEARLELRYTLMGLHADRAVSAFSRGSDLPTLSAPAPSDSAIGGHSYLVTEPETFIQARPVPQVSGGTLYAIDQLVNPDSIEVTPSAWRTPDILLYGRIATVSSSKASRRLYGAFERAITKHFRRVNAFWVGPEAESAWRRGVRLTAGASSPREYDLRETTSDAV